LRLGAGKADLHPLRWRGEHPLTDTIAAWETFKQDSKIRMWGVSQFGINAVREPFELAAGSNSVANPVYFNVPGGGR
jgi:diketogulonate reductase-like aldo/keto reductase